MASQSRKDVFDPREVNVLHCINRCAGQQWLFGVDPETGIDAKYRRDWVVDLLINLARVFSIDIGFVVVMSNHFHLVIRNRPDIVSTWTDEEVIYRWVQASHLTKSAHGDLREPTKKQLKKETAKCKSDPNRLKKLRLRLGDPSEFMKCLDENLSRRVNDDRGSYGHIWEGRFNAKRILNEGALLLAALYVDLNQIRAGEVNTLEQSTFTSAFQRLLAFVSAMRGQPVDDIDGDVFATILETLSVDELVAVRATIPNDVYFDRITKVE